MTIINVNNISLSFGAVSVLDGVSFTLNSGDKLGIVGVNGAGKSSLLKILTGEYLPDSGNITVSSGAVLGKLDQSQIFDPEKTVAEIAYDAHPELLAQEARLAVLLAAAEKEDSDAYAATGAAAGSGAAGIAYAAAHDRFTAEGGYEFRSYSRGMLKNLGFDDSSIDRPAVSLSGGQKTRLALACLLLSSPDILLLDEPTNHLDTDALFWLEDYLHSLKKTVIVVSHDRYFLDRVTGKTLDISGGTAKLYNASYSTFAAQKKRDREILEKQAREQQKEISRIEAYIEQQRRWNRERNIIAAESRQKQLDRVERITVAPTAADIRIGFNEADESGNEVLTVTGLTKAFGEHQVLKGIDFAVRKRERVFICGKNGCGKTTLLKIIAGKYSQDDGYIRYGSGLQMGYFDQENNELSLDKTIIEEMSDTFPALDAVRLRSALAAFLFRGDDIFKQISVLSNGERARITLCKLVMRRLNLLILDEPTNHLDIVSREKLEEALAEFNGTVIAVSHDRYFTAALATRIIDLDGAPDDFPEGFDQYLAARTARAAAEKKSELSAPSDTKQKFLNNKREAAEKRKEERRLERLAAETAETERRLGEIDAEMNGPAATDFVRLGELSEEQQRLEARLLELYEQQM